MSTRYVRYSSELPGPLTQSTSTLCPSIVLLVPRGEGARSADEESPQIRATRPALRLPQAAFTLVEIMVVVVILGILAATIIPQFMGTTQNAKVSAAKSAVSELENALERFNLHMDRYPTTDEGLKILVDPPASEDKRWRGPYIKLLRPDPWGNPYQYRNPGTRRKTGFDLWSRGADGADSGEAEAADIGNW